MDKKRLAEETFDYLLIAPTKEVAQLTDEHLILVLQEIIRRVDAVSYTHLPVFTNSKKSSSPRADTLPARIKEIIRRTTNRVFFICIPPF